MTLKDKRSVPEEEMISLDLLVAIMGKEHIVSDIPSAPCVGKLDFKNADEWIITELGIKGRDLYCGTSGGEYVIVSSLGKVELPYMLFDGGIEESHTRIIIHLFETIKQRIRDKRNDPVDEKMCLGEKLSYPMSVCLLGPKYTVSVFPTAPRIEVLPDLDPRALHLQISSWDFEPILSLDEVEVPINLIHRDIGERVSDGFQPEEGIDYEKKQYPLENYLMKIIKAKVEEYRF